MVAPVVVNPIADQSAFPFGPWQFTIPTNTFTDADGDIVALAVSNLPPWATFNPQTNTISGLPTGPQPVPNIIVTATDSTGQSVSDSFNLTFNQFPPLPPVVSRPISDLTLAQGQTWNFIVPADTFSDINGEVITVATGPLPTWLSFDPSTGTFSGRAPADFQGVVNIDVLGRDPTGFVAIDSFAITVTPEGLPNVAPVVAVPIADQTAVLFMPFSYTIPSNTFTDPNGDALQISVSNLPPWASYDATSRTISGVPLGPQGPANVLITATDAGGLSVSEVFNLSVSQVPLMPPLVTNPIADLSITQGQTLNFVVPANTFTDLNGDPITLFVNSLPAWLSFDQNTRTFSGTAPLDFTGVVDITVLARDPGGLSAPDSFTITVTPQGQNTNLAPIVVTPIEDQSTLLAVPWLFVIPPNLFTDPNGDALEISVSNLPSWAIYNPILKIISGSPTVPGAISSIVITATDSGGLSVSESFNLTVSQFPPLPPFVANPISDLTLTQGQNWSFIVPADTFIDNNGDVLTVSAGLLPDWLTFDPTTNTFSGTAPSDFAGAIDISLVALDPLYLSAVDVFTITVGPPPANIINGTERSDEGKRALTGTADRDVINGLGGSDEIYGNGGNDDLYGGNGADRLFGDNRVEGRRQTSVAGDDFLNGGAGNDELSGGRGNDVLVGGTGRDRLSGGYGADTFVFDDGDSGPGRSQRDVIVDFRHLQGDKIDLSAIDGNAATLEDDTLFFAFNREDALANVGSVVIVENGKNYSVLVNSDAAGGFEFAIDVNTQGRLITDDFIL
jgi:large repetitive protein